MPGAGLRGTSRLPNGSHAVFANDHDHRRSHFDHHDEHNNVDDDLDNHDLDHHDHPASLLVPPIRPGRGRERRLRRSGSELLCDVRARHPGRLPGRLRLPAVRWSLREPCGLPGQFGVWFYDHDQHHDDDQHDDHHASPRLLLLLRRFSGHLFLRTHGRGNARLHGALLRPRSVRGGVRKRSHHQHAHTDDHHDLRPELRLQLDVPLSVLLLGHHTRLDDGLLPAASRSLRMLPVSRTGRAARIPMLLGRARGHRYLQRLPRFRRDVQPANHHAAAVRRKKGLGVRD